MSGTATMQAVVTGRDLGQPVDSVERRAVTGRPCWMGSVTILFTDQVASTALMDRVGDDAAWDIRLTHDRLLRQAVTWYGGRVVKSTGDGFLVIFDRPVDAARCAVSMQRMVDEHRRSQPHQAFSIRIGIHTGRAAWIDGDLFGCAVVVARRLCERAGAAGILMSHAVADRLGTEHGGVVSVSRRLRLKGFSRPVRACLVDWRQSQNHVTRLPGHPPTQRLVDEAQRRGERQAQLVLLAG